MGPISPEIVERVRMALSDCGYDPAAVSERGTFRSSVVPLDVAWRAGTLARMAGGEVGFCFRCASAYWADGNNLALLRACLASLPLTMDCGVEHP